MPVPRPLVAMERASGSVSETCWSGDVELLCDVPQRARLFLDAGELVFEVFDPRLGHQARVTVGTVEFGEVALHALIELLHPRLQLALGEVLVAVVDRLELAAVDGDRGLFEQAQFPAQQDELAAGGADCLTVVLAEVGDGLEVGHQPASQPDQLDVALCFPLQPPARLHPVQIPVDVDLQQRGRVIPRTSRLRGLGALEAKLHQVQRVDEHIDRAYRIAFIDPVVQSLRKQDTLRSILPIDVAAHQQLHQPDAHSNQTEEFSHNLGR